MKTASFRKAFLLLAIVPGIVGASFAQAPKEDDAKARQERVENGLEPVDLGGGQPAVKLSVADLMNATFGSTQISTCITLNGANTFQVGSTVIPYSVSTSGAIALNGYTSGSAVGTASYCSLSDR